MKLTVFLDFLSGLRDGYISRDTDGNVVFQSVILAGVTDVKYVKGRIRDEDKHKVNSPWNIAADFSVDMSLSKEGIEEMLKEYAADNETEMNIPAIAEKIHDYTSGYQQIIDYLNYFQLSTGYLLSFNFNKKKKQGIDIVKIGDKVLYEATM